MAQRFYVTLIGHTNHLFDLPVIDCPAQGLLEIKSEDIATGAIVEATFRPLIRGRSNNVLGEPIKIIRPHFEYDPNVVNEGLAATYRWYKRENKA